MSLDQLIENIQKITDINDISSFKKCVTDSVDWLSQEFTKVPVDQLVHERAVFIDALLLRAWNLVGLNDQKGLALVAVGGYGRGQLQPHSDVDLLILSDKTINAKLQEKVSIFITFLWDIKLDVGQSVRTIKETFNLAKADTTIATNLVESRLLVGSESSFETLQKKIKGKGYWSSKDFFTAKYEEQIERHRKFNDTSYNLEPNVKENPGCLRDIQSIGWVAKQHFNVWNGHELVDHGYFTEGEWAELIESRSHLWQIRFALHLISGRSENRLLFDYQTDVAERLGYGEGKQAVERMMKSFFRTVRRVSELNGMLLQYFKQDILELKVKKHHLIDDNYELLDGLISPLHDDVFKSPEDILSFLLLIANTPDCTGLHSSCLRQLRNARRKFNSQYYCEIPECRKLFMQLMRHPNFFGLGWDLMHKHGILQAYLPQWDNIVGMMQFDLFHAYTVDEHTHRLVKHVYSYHSDENREFPRCKKIVRETDKPELLYLAAIFHDIGKGRNGDHSVLGAADVVTFCESHGIDGDDAELIRWLVENHLLMSVVAQRRDIYDPEIIGEFARAVKSQNHLKHLYALTLADIRATNNNLWNDWKASLIRELYLLTQKALDNGLQCGITLLERVNKHQIEAREMLNKQGVTAAEIDQFWHRLNNDYFARFSPMQLAWHANEVAKAESKDENSLTIALNDTTAKAGTELLVYGKNRPALFAQIASVLDSRNCSIHDAQITITNDGYVFDSFILLEQDGSRISSPSRLKSLVEAIEDQLAKPGREHNNRRKMSRRMKQLDVATKVRFYQSNSEVTMVELEALDAPGLLAKVGHLFVELNLTLHMAKISTIGERAEDLFIIANEQDQALTTEQQVQLKKRLTQLLDQPSTSGEACQS
ncbi:[protein-PII] uridylyltransferase [Aliiglaciecola sp. 2_MG-2023]|uniref:[protein-PII] uridylyltransferase n=1 Tax=unclassified Aliiglaciecola TaxID=2593648 RepID=UPI0026E40740|nr:MULTISPECIES: [protein-PII] uridylyltransferase [unclassified Aliiglaciecola]MDO6710077.1 [protein-PII] uridylyltransferase [Aliiglaciecola sp. 2_MG-2023]MDO6751225.1 [protein-PII] uridylyltransferase [Aliiglaciecola sp. 1_MG-2023]